MVSPFRSKFENIFYLEFKKKVVFSYALKLQYIMSSVTNNFSFNCLFLCILSSVIRLENVQCQTLDVGTAVREYLFKHTQNGTNLTAWEAPESMQKELVYYLSGFDDENRPIWIAEWGKWDVKKYIEAGGEKYQNLDKYLDQQLVRMLQSIKLRSTIEDPVDELVFIIDLDSLPLEQLTSRGGLLFVLEKVASWVPIAQAMEKGFFINTNFVGDQFLNLVKPILGAVFARFDIYGTNKEHWIPKILRHIPKTELPEWYGGVKDFKPIRVYGK